MFEIMHIQKCVRFGYLSFIYQLREQISYLMLTLIKSKQYSLESLADSLKDYVMHKD